MYDRLRATLLGGEQFELTRPSLEGDALVSSDGVSVQLDEIVNIEISAV
jgi:hypothetical protein